MYDTSTETQTESQIVPETARYPGAADLAPGYLIVCEFSITGGTKTESQAEHSALGKRVVKKVSYDHVQLHKASLSLTNKAYLLLRRYCAPAFTGMYFVARGDFPKLDEELQELRDAAKTVNDAARSMGSDRKVTIEIYPVAADKDNPRVALRMGKAIHDLLVRLRDTYSSDIMTAYTSEIRSIKNLDKVVTGRQGDLVRDALRSAEAQRPLMIAAYGGKRGVEEVMRNGRLPDFDYGPIDRAIAAFAEASEAF